MCSSILATDRYEATFLFSRLSNPGGGSTGDREVLRTNNTILAGGRLGAQIGDFAEVALHTANAHQSHTLLDKQAGNPFAGSLTIGQNKTISLVKLVLRDDSPEDGVGGGGVFSRCVGRADYLSRWLGGIGQGHWL